MKTTLRQLLVDAILAMIIFTQITGCATTYDREALQELLNEPNRYRLFVPTKEQIATNARIPPLSVKHFPHAANVTVEWSNGFKETVELTLTAAEQGKHYAILAVELNPDQQSKDVTLEVKYLGDELLPSLRYQRIEGGGRGWPAEVGAALWFFLWPLVLYGYIAKATEVVTERPFVDCCFVWAANAETGETLEWASRPPESAKVIFPSSKSQTAPNGKTPGLN